MVTYQKFTKLAFEVAQSQGMQSTRENTTDLVSIVAEIWNERKAELMVATDAEARIILEQELSVA